MSEVTSLFETDRLAFRPPTRRAVLGTGLAFATMVGLPACSEAPAAPRPIKWNRESCEFCHMVFADRRFSAEWWDADLHRARAFDDFGCAVLAADEAGVIDRSDVAFWVSDDADPTRWLDARAVHFRDGQATAMGYGYSAGTSPLHRLDFATAAAAIRDKAACEHKPQGGTP